MQLSCKQCGAIMYSSGSDDDIETGVGCACGGRSVLHGLTIACVVCGRVCVSFSCCGQRGEPVGEPVFATLDCTAG